MNRQSIFALAAVLFMWSSCHGTVVVYDLSCEGSYVKGDSWTTDFDLGVEFSEISDIYIDWSGSLKASKWVSLFPFIHIDPYYSSYFRAALYDLNSSSSLEDVSVSGGVGTYPNFESFDLQSKFYMNNYSALLDGTGTIKISLLEYHPLISHTDLALVKQVTFGAGELSPAKLIFVGTEVPEPCTLLLFGLGGVLLKRRK